MQVRNSKEGWAADWAPGRGWMCSWGECPGREDGPGQAWKHTIIRRAGRRHSRDPGRKKATQPSQKSRVSRRKKSTMPNVAEK